MTTHRFTPEQIHHVDQAHGAAIQAAVVGLALLRSAERAAGIEPLPTWQIEEWAQKLLEDMGSEYSSKPRETKPDSEPDSEDIDAPNIDSASNPMDGIE